MAMDFKPFRDALVDKLDTMERRTGAVEANLRGGDGRLELDSQDRASLTENDEVLVALDDAGRDEIVLLRSALDRLDAGTYGTCLRCGGGIAPGRLAALPEAPFCAACAAGME